MLTHWYAHASVYSRIGIAREGILHVWTYAHAVSPTSGVANKPAQTCTNTYAHLHTRACIHTQTHTHTHLLANAAHKYKVMCAYTVSICTGMHRYDVANVYMRVTAYIDVRACTANIYICIGLCVRAWTYVHAHMYIYIGMRVTAYIDYVHVDIHPQLCVFSPKMLSEY